MIENDEQETMTTTLTFEPIPWIVPKPRPRWLRGVRGLLGWGSESRRLEARTETDDEHDLRLLRLATAGDDEAFRTLVDRHHRKLLAVCGRLLGDREEAQDVVQETFLQVYRKAESLRPGTRVGGWLYRVAVNGSLKRLRRRGVVRFLSLTPAPGGSSEPTLPDASDPTPRPDRRLEARERWLRTRRQIDALPPRQRVVLVLARFEGLSMRQVAETLGISERAAEGRLARALAKLQAIGDRP